ncbi:MAG: hypothetical protein Q8R82_07250 [Hyphomonadaceae bacterium]|nr:hypothetical protein [Hyphomonadaceae bacterium]
MVDLLLTLLRILFPLDPIARLREITRDYISQIMGWLDDPFDVEEIHHREDLREILEAHIITAEHGVQLLITERARQIAGLPFIYTARIAPPYLRRTKSLSRLLKRLTNLARLFHNLEQLAHRRAERIIRERGCPLRLDATHQSTSPALRAEEENHLRGFAVQISSSSPKDWGRWIARPCAQDGGGRYARGPPTLQNFQKPNPAPTRTHPRERPRLTSPCPAGPLRPCA